MKWKKLKEQQTSEGKKLEREAELSKSLNDNSLNSLIEKEEFSTSKVTEQNESMNIVLEIVLENDFHRTRFICLARNATDNRALRRKKPTKQKQVSIDTGKETDNDKTYANRVEKPAEQVVDLSQIYSELLAGRNRSSKMDTSPPNLCTNSGHISNDSGSPNEERN